MRVIVVGAGIVGVCTAYWLNRHGMSVTVVDRRSGVAQEASFGNGGVFAPDHASPSAAPGMAGKLLSQLFKPESALFLRASLDPALWRWTMKWMGQATLERLKANKRAMHRIGRYSRDQLHVLRTEYGFEYEQRQGCLQLLRTASDMALAAPILAMLKENGIRHHSLSAAEAMALEPCLIHAHDNGTPLAGAVHFPDDESGNCPLFARLMSQVCEREGVTFVFNNSAEPVRDGIGAVSGVRLSDARVLSADAVVLANGADAAPLLGRLGIRVPVYAVKGYSASVALRPDTHGPRQAFIDQAYKTSLTPFGRRLRISGTVELGSRTAKLREKALRTLIKVGHDWLPGALDTTQTSWWGGTRLTTPDGPPILGATRLRGLFVNIGHGSQGWAMAPGSGKVMADLIAGREPDIDIHGLDIGRTSRKN